MKIVLTGANGFVGNHLRPLLEAHKGVELIPIDINDGIDLCNWNEVKDIRADLFVHLANRTFVPESYEHPREFYETNVSSTYNVLELARLSGARVIYISSYIYGQSAYLPIDESHPIQAFNPYSTTKVMCEEMCKGYARDFNVPICIFRPFNIYGKGQNCNFLIPMLAQQIKTGKVQVRDDRPKRDYIHIRDVVSAIDTMVFSEWPTTYEIYNLGSGLSFSVYDVVQKMIALTGNSKIEYTSLGETRPNEVLDTIADISKIKTFGWTPKVSLEEGLKEILIDEI